MWYHRPEKSLAALASAMKIHACASQVARNRWGGDRSGRQGIIEANLSASTEKWGSGAKDDIPLEYKAELRQRRVAHVQGVVHARVGGAMIVTIDALVPEHVNAVDHRRSRSSAVTRWQNTQEAGRQGSCGRYSTGARTVYRDALERWPTQPT